MKFNSHATRGDLTPAEYDEIWRRFLDQLQHDAAVESIDIMPGMENYVLRQIAFYINQVKRERRKIK